MVEFIGANDLPRGKESATARAARELTQLHKQTAEARAELARLLQGVTDIENKLSGSHGVALLEANEQLIITLMRNQTERAAWALIQGARSAEHSVDSLTVIDYDHLSAGYEHRHAQLQEANEQLVLAALGAQELQAAAERAQRQQTEFLALISHELRHPLSPISMAVSLMGRVGSAELPRVQAIIGRQVAHLTRLIGDLLDVSRVAIGKLRLERRPIDLALTLFEVAEAGKPAMEAHLQNFEVHIPAGHLNVLGDEIRLTQVFSNLLDNASKYTPEGGSISLIASAMNDNVLVTIADSGIGITAEALPHVFDPFVQDSHAVGFNGTGLGIGLTVVRELVEAHSGTVVARSEGFACGSQFVVTLPMLSGPMPVRQ